MEIINFKSKCLLDNSEIIIPTALDNKFMLLAFFLGSYYNLDFLQSDVIEPLESILKGEKTFEEIQEGYAAWTFADDYCEFEVEGTTAYFTNDKNHSQDLEMPLEEVVDYLKEWKAFLES